ncbi:MAG TPA: phosphatase PAP2 family protein [Rhizomicrobium sp.]|nr:phosphatase PAP2 family protein [Rhizomicrobium sp.]
MRIAVLVSALTLAWSVSAQAGLLEPRQFDPSHFLPPAPAQDSARTQTELAELRAIAAGSSAQEKAAAAKDAKDETPDIFNGVIGFDIATMPETNKLLTMVAEEEDSDSKVAKAYFHRVRPYAADPLLKTCEPTKPGKAANSYPSGHATLAFSMGVVLADLMPAKSQAILARAGQYAERRLVCGVHYRSDIVAGQQFGTILALRLMENPAFETQMEKARAELRAART